MLSKIFHSGRQFALEQLPGCFTILWPNVNQATASPRLQLVLKLITQSPQTKLTIIGVHRTDQPSDVCHVQHHRINPVQVVPLGERMLCRGGVRQQDVAHRS